MAGELHMGITGDASGLVSAVAKSKAALGELNDAAQTAGSGIDDVLDKFKSIAAVAGVSLGAAGVMSFTKKIYEARSAMQDLESTMKVFLGSEEKASKFTKELQDYAYWNMFDFPQLTEASTQLMAYGVATEELIPTIDKLSNVATGTKKPLQDYVNLFNKAKSTGKVDAAGLQSWAAAGIVLKDELKKLGQQVDGNNVSFEQLQMVLNHVTSDGERFGGLMMSQMDNLSASWGQLEDNFANMLNELGEKFQDTFKSGIDFAGVLIDNYEKIGKALFALIAMYGEYKAVLIATAAIQKAQAFMENIKLIGMFRKELGLLKAAQQAFNITAMQNPYVLMAAAIIMTCTAIWGLVSAFKDDRTEVEKLNDTYDDRVRALQDEQRQANEHIRTLKDETASTEALRNAREQLANMDAFKDAGISSAQLAYMSPEEIQKKMQEYYAQQEALAKQEKKEGTNARRTQLEKQYVYGMDRDLGVAYGAQQIGRQQAASAKAEIKELDTNEINDYVQELASSKKPLEEQQAALQRNIDRWNGYKQAAEESNKVLEAKTNKTKEDYEQMDKNNLLIERAENATTLFSDAIRANQQAIEQRDTVEQGLTLPELIQKIHEAEEAVKKATADYAANMNEENKKNLENANNELKGYTDSYQKATGNQWVSQKALNDKIRSDNQKLRDEEAKQNAERLKDTRARILEEARLRKEQVDQEETEFKRNNNGRGHGKDYIDRRKRFIDAEVQVQLDKANADFAKWRKQVEAEKINLRTQIDTEALQAQLARTTSIAEQQSIRTKIRKTEDTAMENERQSATNEEMRGIVDDPKKVAEVRKLWQQTNGDMSKITDEQKAQLGLTDETLTQLFAVEKKYEDIYKLKQMQVDQSRIIEDSNAQLDRLDAYYQTIEQLEQEHAENMRSLLESGASKEDIAKETNLYQRKKEQAGRTLSNNPEEQAFAQRMATFAQDIAGQSYEQIEQKYQEFMTALDADIATLQTEIESAKKTQQANLASAQQDLSNFDQEHAGEMEGLSEEEKNAMFEQRAEIVARIFSIENGQDAISAERIKKEQQLTTLINGRNKAEQSALNAEQNADTQRTRAQQRFAKNVTASYEGLNAVKSAAQAVGDTLGGAMSQDAKKALQGIMDIADIGMKACQAIEAVSNAASISVSTTASTAEKASVILMAIAAIVQLCMAAVKFFSQFTAEAKMQEEIDKTKAKVEDLKREQEKLERQYKSKVGSEYYKGMAEAAENYNNLLRENNRALQKAIELEERQKQKHGEDSDKAQDAKEQRQELEDAQAEFEDAQRELREKLAEELLTTNVTSFAEGLADNLVDAWSEGTSDMSEIWNTMLDDMKRDMMKKALSIALTDMFKSTFDKISQLAQDGQLNQAEIDQAIAEIDAKSAQAEAIAEQWRQAMEERGLLDDANPEADAGGFGQMSQDTADELNARFTALQMEGASVVASATSILESILLMQANSDKSVMLIQDIDRFQQLAYEQSQEHIDLVRAISENVSKISADTARLKAIEQNTDRL